MPSASCGPLGRGHTCSQKLLRRLTLLSVLLILTPATAQGPPPPPTTSTAVPASTSNLTSQSPNTISSSRSVALTTSITVRTITPESRTTSTQSSLTTTTSAPISPTATGVYPTNTGGTYFPDTNTAADKTISQYYYIIILAGAVVLAVFIWLLHLRRRRRKAASRSRRTSALAQDVNNYPSHRRWLHGAWRGIDGQSRREEGLDERGEAPPPYKASEPTDSSISDDSYHRGESSRGSDTVSIPLRTYHPTTSHGQKPPEYGEAFRPVN